MAAAYPAAPGSGTANPDFTVSYAGNVSNHRRTQPRLLLEPAGAASLAAIAALDLSTGLLNIMYIIDQR